MGRAWYIVVKGQERGPYPSKKIKELVKTGKLKADRKLRREDMDRAVPAGQIKGLRDALATAGSTAPAEQAVAAPAPAAATPSPATGAAGGLPLQFFVVRKGREHGPFDKAQLQRLADQGKINPETRLRNVALDYTNSAKRVKGLFTEAQITAAQEAKRARKAERSAIPQHLVETQPVELPAAVPDQPQPEVGPAEFSIAALDPDALRDVDAGDGELQAIPIEDEDSARLIGETEDAYGLAELDEEVSSHFRRAAAWAPDDEDVSAADTAAEASLDRQLANASWEPAPPVELDPAEEVLDETVATTIGQQRVDSSEPVPAVVEQPAAAPEPTTAASDVAIEESVEAMPASTAATDEIFIPMAIGEVGPLTREQLYEYVFEGEVESDDEVRLGAGGPLVPVSVVLASLMPERAESADAVASSTDVADAAAEGDELQLADDEVDESWAAPAGDAPAAEGSDSISTLTADADVAADVVAAEMPDGVDEPAVVEEASATAPDQDEAATVTDAGRDQAGAEAPTEPGMAATATDAVADDGEDAAAVADPVATDEDEADPGDALKESIDVASEQEVDEDIADGGIAVSDEAAAVVIDEYGETEDGSLAVDELDGATAAADGGEDGTEEEADAGEPETERLQAAVEQRSSRIELAYDTDLDAGEVSSDGWPSVPAERAVTAVGDGTLSAPEDAASVGSSETAGVPEAAVDQVQAEPEATVSPPAEPVATSADHGGDQQPLDPDSIDVDWPSAAAVRTDDEAVGESAAELEPGPEPQRKRSSRRSSRRAAAGSQRIGVFGRLFGRGRRRERSVEEEPEPETGLAGLATSSLRSDEDADVGSGSRRTSEGLAAASIDGAPESDVLPPSAGQMAAARQRPPRHGPTPATVAERWQAAIRPSSDSALRQALLQQCRERLGSDAGPTPGPLARLAGDQRREQQAGLLARRRRSGSQDGSSIVESAVASVDETAAGGPDRLGE